MAGAGAGAEKGTKVEPEPKRNSFGSATLLGTTASESVLRIRPGRPYLAGAGAAPIWRLRQLLHLLINKQNVFTPFNLNQQL